ncbi:MAG: SpoIIE family protein phosphatase, partial [Bacteroidota bacterium]
MQFEKLIEEKYQKLRQKNTELEKIIDKINSDLELKNRDLEIEAALERVRSRTMAMHNTSELQDVINTVYQQFRGLDIAITGGVFIAINDDIEKEIACWGAGGTAEYVERVHIPFIDLPIYTGLVEGIRKGPGFFTEEFTYQEKIDFFNHLFKQSPYNEMPSEHKKEVISREGGYTRSCAVSKYTSVFIINHHGRKFLNEENDVLIKFTKVFEQTYTRFLDLQKAEEQTREAQIEAALERVRSKAMGMNSSEDLALTIDHFFQELKNLDVKPIRCGVGIKDGDSPIVDVTVTSANKNGEDIKLTGKLTLGGHPILDKVYEALQLQAEYFPVLRGEEINEYYQAMNPDIEFPNFSKDDVQYGYYFHFKEGGVFAWTEKELLEVEINIFRRFKSVLSLTYRRYLDLKESEAQAKEAQIEAALERVRSRTMAMHKSEDLTSAVAAVFTELEELGFTTIRCGIGIFNDKSRKVNVWTASDSNENDTAHLSGDEILEGHPLLEGIFKAWENQHDYSYVLEGDDLINYYEVAAESNLPVSGPKANDEKITQYYHSVMFQAGGIFAFRENEFTTEAKQLMKRFADVFHLTFIRHLDLKKAEAQNKIIQAENERKTRELEEARQLQLSMLPKDLPQLPNLEIAVYMQTATEVGGDYYDFHVRDDGVLTAVIGDATGHGMKAGTIVTITKSLFNSLASSKNILKTFAKISKAIKDMNFRQLTMCMILLKIKGNHLTLSSAGMPPVMIYRKQKQEIEELSFEGMPLGAMRNFPYRQLDRDLEKGDVILLLTDGLPELKNQTSEMYGYEKIKNEFLSVSKRKPEEIIDHLKNSA